MGWEERLEKEQDSDVKTVAIQVSPGRQSFTQNLATAVLAVSTSFAAKFRILQITIHSTVAITETVTVTFNSLIGDAYDTIIAKLGFGGTQDMVLIAGDNMAKVFGDEGDEIDIACTNGGGVGVLSGEIMVQLLE